MIVWATEFPLPTATTADQILELVEKWLRGSPFLPFKGFAFPAVPEGQTVAVSHLGQSLQLSRVAVGSDWWLAGRHSWTENQQREWITDIVAHRASGTLSVAVRLECNLVATGLALPQPKKPYIMRMLLTTLGGGTDSWLTVDDEPTYLSESQVNEAAAIIDGTASNKLPVVYLSARADRKPALDAVKLAQWLAGMAHVVVEPSRHFSFALARNTQWRNPYDGAVAVLWPKAAAKQRRLLPRDFASPNDLAVEIAGVVRTVLTTVRPTHTLTWPYVQELVASRRVEALKAEGSAGLDEYVKAFDDELQAKTLRTEEAEREIGRLHAEIRRLESTTGNDNGVLQLGKEAEYYPGEIQDAVVQALSLALGQMDVSSRRRHLVEDLIAWNAPSNNADDFIEQIKRAFATSGDLTTAARRILEDLGFEISEEGRHYKALFQGDGRYTFTISKTSSDHRAGKNLASHITRTLFR